MLSSITSTRNAILTDDIGRIPDVHIFNKTKKTGAITNLNGEFTIEASDSDVIEITHQSYATKVILGKDLKGTIELLNSSNVLDDVEISSKKKRKYLLPFLGVLGLLAALLIASNNEPEKAVL
ncbi:hypothetical protein [uncultured Tenacibaculum sp.]|uniref:hypothetical protein n=1 Tax=uncultured Tenacibaculum sp. TaxID=174713 RepID=UPI00262B1214|nr:hypothetical protein [uncultured Tenacibaculum sp.]